jgi:hypothetical protein
MASRTASKDIITLKGSAAIVSEFFGTPRAAPPPDPLTLCPFAVVSNRAIFVGRLRGEQVRRREQRRHL